MKKMPCLAGLVVLALATTAGAETTAAEGAPTFTKDVAPILYENCVACHRSGELAPMSLLTYRDARPWARAIKQKVASREMPPWYADPNYGDFANDARLSQEDVDTIVAWVDAGAPKGEEKDLPRLPEFTEGWSIGEPDAVFSMLEPFEVPADGTVPYLYFTIPTNLTEDKWVKAIEIKPGDRRVVHHVIADLLPADDTPPSPEPTLRRAGRPTGSLGGVTPNKFGVVYPEGVARLLKAGSEIVLQMHYTTIGVAATDRTSIGLIFSERPKQILSSGNVINLRFVISAGAANHEVQASRTFDEDVYLFDMMPHMHSLGKDFTYKAVYPDGREEIILRVPNYNFNWQLTYQLKEPKLLPKGTTLVGIAHFDNSANNRANPDPTRDVRWGDQTWEEMMIGWYKTVSAADATDGTTGNQQ